MDLLNYKVERTVEIQASCETVFSFFTDSGRWAKWWGAGSAIEPHAGGRVYIRHPNAVEVVGEVIEIVPPDRIVFTWENAGGKPIAEGGSRVTILLERNGAGTKLRLLHEFNDEAVRDEHLQGWRFQLALFANVVADEMFADAAGLVDAWFNAWALEDQKARDLEFARIAVADVLFRDRFSLLDGLADLSAHAGASQRFMPGIRMRRKGDVRHCQGTIIADWVATSADGQERMNGTNVFVMEPGGRIDTVTGLMNLPPTH
jgi:uncharacterized protein YndB with AHSA1/START domain